MQSVLICLIVVYSFFCLAIELIDEEGDFRFIMAPQQP